MKRLSSSDDSLGALMSICPTSDEQSPRSNQVYGREFRSMLEGLEEEGCIEETGHVSEKKRRLSVDQVKALEKNFEVENKLEPERKVKLAQELGLQPRQVAVWFQNRRARWKTKQLERDYGVLKANYDTLKLNYNSLQHENEALHKEINELKSKLQEENTESNVSVKEEPIAPMIEQSKDAPLETTLPTSEESKELNFESFNNGGVGMEVSIFPDFKDGSSDSDSSAILNEDNNSSPNAISSSGVLQNHQILMSPKHMKASHKLQKKWRLEARESTSKLPVLMKVTQVEARHTASAAKGGVVSSLVQKGLMPERSSPNVVETASAL